MEHKKAKRLAEVIFKVRLKKATQTERVFLNDWLDESEANRQIYKQIVRGKAISQRLQSEAKINATADFDQIKEHIVHFSTLRQRSRFRRLWIWTSAAVFAGILITVYITPKAEKEFTPYSLPSEVIASAPSTDTQTILITADGQQVGLDKQIPDSIVSHQALIRGEKGKLLYEGKSPVIASESEMKEEWNKVITPVGGEYFISLSDHTKVWMNANTTLEFPVNFINHERIVKLEGEAYFEVTRDEQKPFIVETKGMRTKVLGTSFNIKAYADENEERTTLLQGSVEISSNPANSGISMPSMILKPGMQARWQTKRHNLSVENVRPEEAIAWREGKFIFNEEDLHVVLRTLTRWYGVQFISEDAEMERYTFSGIVCKNDSLESTLEILSLAGGPAFKLKGDKVYMSKNKSRP